MTILFTQIILYVAIIIKLFVWTDYLVLFGLYKTVHL